MFKQGMIVAAAITALSSATAFAKETPQPSSTDASAPAPSSKTRYCLKSEPVTGSIVQGRVCKTANQWREEGVDVSKFAQRN